MRNNEKGAGLKYIFRLAGKNKILLLISAVFSVCSGLCTFLVPFIMFFYMLHLNAAMAFCLLLPLILGFVLMTIAMKITSKYNETYHVLLEKLNSSTMEFINGMQVMKIFHITAESFRRLNTIESVDQILVMDEGRFIEDRV